MNDIWLMLKLNAINALTIGRIKLLNRESYLNGF